MTLSAGFIAAGINVMMLSGPPSQVWEASLILAVGLAILIGLTPKVMLTADCVVVRNFFVTRRIPLDRISYITNLTRGSVHIRTIDGQTIQVYAVNTPTIATYFSLRSRANPFIEAIEDAALARGAPIDPSHYRRAIGAARNKHPKSAGQPSTGSSPGGQEIEERHAGAHRRHGPILEAPFPRRKWGPGYRRSEVDEFMSRVRATILGDRTERPVTASEIRGVNFGITHWGGYDDRAVDAALDHYATGLSNDTP